MRTRSVHGFRSLFLFLRVQYRALPRQFYPTSLIASRPSDLAGACQSSNAWLIIFRPVWSLSSSTEMRVQFDRKGRSTSVTRTLPPFLHTRFARVLVCSENAAEPVPISQIACTAATPHAHKATSLSQSGVYMTRIMRMPPVFGSGSAASLLSVNHGSSTAVFGLLARLPVKLGATRQRGSRRTRHDNLHHHPMRF
ncbi:hypothetical protein BC567DRAFT_43894 [Phyllosticta citribraziliensis]